MVGCCRYGWVVLVVEMIGATTIVLYGVNLLFNPVVMVYEEDPAHPGKPITRRPYHVRCLVPCYKESLDILRRTIMALYDAQLPEVRTPLMSPGGHRWSHGALTVIEEVMVAKTSVGVQMTQWRSSVHPYGEVDHSSCAAYV